MYIIYTYKLNFINSDSWEFPSGDNWLRMSCYCSTLFTVTFLLTSTKLRQMRLLRFPLK